MIAASHSDMQWRPLSVSESIPILVGGSSSVLHVFVENASVTWIITATLLLRISLCFGCKSGVWNGCV